MTEDDAHRIEQIFGKKICERTEKFRRRYGTSPFPELIDMALFISEWDKATRKLLNGKR